MGSFSASSLEVECINLSNSLYHCHILEFCYSRARPIWNSSPDYSVNCATRSPITITYRHLRFVFSTGASVAQSLKWQLENRHGKWKTWPVTFSIILARLRQLSSVFFITVNLFHLLTRSDMPPMAAIFAIGSGSLTIPKLSDEFSESARDFVCKCLIRYVCLFSFYLLANGFIPSPNYVTCGKWPF